MRTSPFLKSIPGAVPLWLNKTSHASGTNACCLLRSTGSRPNPLKSCTMCSHTSSRKTISELKYFASVCLVRSSLVGPRPPVTITNCVSAYNPSMASTMASGVSEMLLMRVTSIPSSFKTVPNHALLVSTICPINISSPMVMISAFTNLCLNLRFQRYFPWTNSPLLNSSSIQTAASTILGLSHPTSRTLFSLWVIQTELRPCPSTSTPSLGPKPAVNSPSHEAP